MTLRGWSRRNLLALVLGAIVLSLVPATIGPDMLVRFRHEPMLTEQDTRIRVFFALVVPVVEVYRYLGIRAGYDYLVHYPDMANYPPRPSTMAFQHLLEAVPLWIVVLWTSGWLARRAASVIGRAGRRLVLLVRRKPLHSRTTRPVA